MSKLKMTLLENSKSFFIESISKAVQAEKSEEHWKFAILLLVQAIETCLKERLRWTQEILIYSNIDKPKHTVDLWLAISRLEKISKVELDSSDFSAIKTASDLRNQIVHFEFNLSIEQIKSNFVTLVGFYTEFCQKHLDEDIIANLPYPLDQEVMKLDKYVDELEQRAKSRIENEAINSENVWECSACKRDSFVIEDAIDTCYVCGYYEPTVECESCSELELESEIQGVDFGNMKGIENWKYFCRDCYEKLETENPYDEYY
ncbi:hypothetical protein [Pseudoalteromonas sp. CnMc7-37]|uniref:hypothetical protein n=1 Tax=Pseudoalteromonas sp. CnMc7-37 TaxID=2954496 RepID=UPI0020982E52|nr:hypothetical protein [Pseudoalteromonas sp. CnMc7-37]MCO7205320.1 hypothetical protein [Pseudoalteromonas sp. CnMc7-37]